MRNFQNCTIHQNAYVVNDLDSAIRRWTTAFNVGPFFTTTHDILYDSYYRGNPATLDAKIAVAYAGDLQIEFVQVTESGPNVYHDVHPRGTEGFHHVSIIPDDYDAELARWNALGYETVTTAKFGDDIRLCFLDTYRDFGFMLEFNSEHPFLRTAFRRMKEEALRWDGVTRPSRPIAELFEND